MKKTFCILIFTILLSGCTESTIQKDRDYSENIKTQFYENMNLEEVRQKLIRFESDIEFYNECLEQFEYPVTHCEKDTIEF